MRDVELDIDPSVNTLVLEIPAGDACTFSLVAYGRAASAVKTFAGSATADLVAGEAKDVNVTLSIEETGIVMPDNQNNRVLMIDDISGAGYTMLEAGDLVGLGWNVGDFWPLDVSLDSQGRISVSQSKIGEYGPAMLGGQPWDVLLKDNYMYTWPTAGRRLAR